MHRSTRREFLRDLVLGAGAAALSSCAPAREVPPLPVVPSNSTQFLNLGEVIGRYGHELATEPLGDQQGELSAAMVEAIASGAESLAFLRQGVQYALGRDTQYVNAGALGMVTTAFNHDWSIVTLVDPKLRRCKENRCGWGFGTDEDQRPQIIVSNENLVPVTPDGLSRLPDGVRVKTTEMVADGLNLDGGDPFVKEILGYRINFWDAGKEILFFAGACLVMQGATMALGRFVLRPIGLFAAGIRDRAAAALLMAKDGKKASEIMKLIRSGKWIEDAAISKITQTEAEMARLLARPGRITVNVNKGIITHGEGAWVNTGTMEAALMPQGGGTYGALGPTGFVPQGMLIPTSSRSSAIEFENVLLSPRGANILPTPVKLIEGVPANRTMLTVPRSTQSFSSLVRGDNGSGVYRYTGGEGPWDSRPAIDAFRRQHLVAEPDILKTIDGGDEVAKAMAQVKKTATLAREVELPASKVLAPPVGKSWVKA